MADIRLYTKYIIIDYDNGKFIEVGDTITNLTFYDDELEENITLKNVYIRDVDDCNVEVEIDNDSIVNIDPNCIIDFDY